VKEVEKVLYPLREGSGRIEGLKGFESWKKRKRKRKRKKGKCQECTWKCALSWGAKCAGKDEWLSKYNVTVTEEHTAATA